MARINALWMDGKLCMGGGIFNMTNILITYQPKHSGENLLEEPTVMPDLPKLMALDTFRNAIVEKFNERLGIERVRLVISNARYIFEL